MGILPSYITLVHIDLTKVNLRCGPCKMIAPHLEEISKTMSDVVVLKVDVDDCEDVAAEYKVCCY